MSNYYNAASVEDLLESIPDMFSFWGFLPTRISKEQPRGKSEIGLNGLKSLIARPHNLYVSENEKGELTAYHIDLVYTPFSKEDIDVEIHDDILTVMVGKDEKKPLKPMVYRGISAKPFTFQLYVRNFFDESEEIDVDNIKASPHDGILSLTFPLKKKAPVPESKPIKIPLS